MATQRSPKTPSTSIPAQPKRSAFPSAIPSAPRPSISSIISNNDNSLNLSVAASPSPPSNASSTPSGIPAFRSLRSLLPFGPNKHPTTASGPGPSPHGRGPFANFGSVRRSMSMSRGRGGSESAAEAPVIAIGRNSNASEDTSVRKSLSHSNFEKDKPLPNQPPSMNEGARDDDDTIVFKAPVLRALSPGPPISADLSIILEADTSGTSKHIPSFSGPSPPTSPALPTLFTRPPANLPVGAYKANASNPERGKGKKAGQELEADVSVLDLSTTHVKNQVLHAMLAEDSNVATQWLHPDNAVVIDDDDQGPSASSSPPPRKTGPSSSSAADQSFNLGTLDPDLAALLSPNRLPNSKTHVKRLSIVPKPPYPPVIDLSQPSPASAHFPPSPSGSSPGITPSPSSQIFPLGGGSSPGSFKSAGRPLPPKQQSSLPRLRPPTWHSPAGASATTVNAVASGSPEDVSDGTSTSISPAIASADSSGTQTQTTTPPYRHTPAPPSPLSLFTAPSSSSSTNVSTMVLPVSTPSISSRRSIATPQPRVFSPPSSRLPSAKGIASLPNRPPLRQMTSAPSSPPPTEWGEIEKEPSPRPPSRPSSASTHRRQGTGSTAASSRPSIDSTPRGSLDRYQRSFRPSLESSPLVGSEEQSISGDKPRTSIDRDNLTVPIRPSSRNREATLTATRSRKRSMSVQDRFGGSGSGRQGLSTLLSPHHQHTRSRDEHTFENLRSSSSLSGRFPSGRAGFSGHADKEREKEKPPATEWLGPRTVKAFKAAGLMDFDREREVGGDRNGSGIGLGLGPPQGKFGFGSGFQGRATSEYGPGTRAHSRMAFSEAGSGGGGSAGRRGSGSGTLSSYGLMESPTFTGSSGSRDRDTPTTTAPTSVGSPSGSPFGFLGREKEREKEEIRELKDKHLTETGALLGALSDSQRTTKMLREENGELRERIDRLGNVEMENEGLRRTVGELGKEVGELRVQLAKAGVSTNRAGWTARRSGLGTSTSSTGMNQTDEKRGTSTKGKAVHSRGDLPSGISFSLEHEPDQDDDELDLERTPQDHFPNPDYDGPVSSTPAPIPKTQQRRFSTTSSIFPAPPANMTMLLHDSDDGGSMRLSGSPPVSINGRSHHNHNNSVASISPTTANFSMVTGSPGSLFLRPEHEVHLGDMESLDLGVRSGSDGLVANDDDGW